MRTTTAMRVPLSEPTPCAYCQYEELKREAAERGVLLRVRAESRFLIVRFDDQAHDSAWFLELPSACVC